MVVVWLVDIVVGTPQEDLDQNLSHCEMPPLAYLLDHHKMSTCLWCLRFSATPLSYLSNHIFYRRIHHKNRLVPCTVNCQRDMSCMRVCCRERSLNGELCRGQHRCRHILLRNLWDTGLRPSLNCHLQICQLFFCVRRRSR